MRTIIFLFLLPSFSVFAQTGGFHLSGPDSLRQIGDIKGTVIAYKQMYQSQGKDFKGFYNYACALAVDGQADSAFKYLDSEYVNYKVDPFAFCDPDFLALRKDKRWDAFENRLIAEIQKKNNQPYKDVEYAKELWLMMAKDQAYYDCIQIAKEKTGMNSLVVQAIWELKERINDENQKELEKLIEDKGWPKKSQVGERATTGAFLIIQHSDADKQKKYLPTIEKLCKGNEARWGDYALMYDRIQISDKKPQKYGSQIQFNDQTQKYELFPLLDEEKVDQWRKEAGLGPLVEYLANWNIKFEPKK
jgi:hypothetical protein